MSYCAVGRNREIPMGLLDSSPDKFIAYGPAFW
ncbi:protein of unknown function [Magnetospirillum sp. XM-1]|nr:protein of unknown function [Magnetospirillum sp. XM-1]